MNWRLSELSLLVLTVLVGVLALEITGTVSGLVQAIAIVIGLSMAWAIFKDHLGCD